MNETSAAVASSHRAVLIQRHATDLPRIGRGKAVAARVFASALAGLLLYLSFQPRPYWWLAPIGLAVLYATVRHQKARAAFGYATVVGLVMMGLLLRWTGEFVGPVGAVPLTVLEAVLVGLAGAGIARTTILPAAPIWAAAMWVAGEWVRAVVPFGGFPWAKIAYSQLDGIFMTLVAVGGTPLVSFAVALVGFSLADLILRLARGHRSGQSTSMRIAATRTTAIVILTVAGGLASTTLVSTAPEAGEVTVAAIQGNVPRAGLDFNAQRRAVLDNHVNETLRLATKVNDGQLAAPDLVIWPENSSDIDPYRNADAYNQIDRAARAVGVPIAVGAVVAGDTPNPRNVSILWDPQRGPVDEYTKRRLQPFGETMPWRPFFRIFTPLVDRAGRFVPGTQPKVLTMGRAQVGIVMCYEVAFDAVVRSTVRSGATLIAVPSNNATFGYTDMTYQQLAMDRVRAIEHGRTVVVATTSGVSAIINADGKVADQTTLFTPATVIDKVALRTTTTWADRVGGWPEGLLVAMGFVGLAYSAGRRRSIDKVAEAA